MITPLLLVITCCDTHAHAGDASRRHDLRAEQFAIRDTEAEALLLVASRLEAEGNASHARAIRGLVGPAPLRHGPGRFEPLPEIVPGEENQGQDDVSAEVEKMPEVSALREEAARSYAELAERAYEEGLLAVIDSCLREVLRRKPDDPETRRLLGYVPHEGGWATPHAVHRLKNGDIPHEKYGWIPGDWVTKLEEGLLPAPSRQARGALSWIPAAEADAARQGSIAQGWQITTPHFKIQASVPLDEGIDFARRLEAFYDLFTSIAADVIGPERLQLAQLKRSARVTAPVNAPRQHRVFYFGTKQQYVEYLTPRLRDPGIKDTLGIYLDEPKISYFFKDEGGQLPVEATLYHEVSHQLLFELAGPSKYQQNLGNFWVFEGLGTYFETVEPQDDGSILYGGRVGPRFEEASRRHREQEDLIPIAQFVGLDRNAFNGASGGDPYLHYAQAVAFAIFLMDHEFGRYREAFLEYAGDAYRGRLRPGSNRNLSSHLSLTYGELDRAFRAFLDGQEDHGPGSSDERLDLDRVQEP